MAILNITECSEIAQDSKGRIIPAGVADKGVTIQNVTYTTATQSAALASKTRFVRLIADADCWVLFGDNPTATASNATRLEADVAEWFGVTGDGNKISAYDGSS